MEYMFNYNAIQLITKHVQIISIFYVLWKTYDQKFSFHLEDHHTLYYKKIW